MSVRIPDCLKPTIQVSVDSTLLKLEYVSTEPWDYNGDGAAECRKRMVIVIAGVVNIRARM